MSDQPKSSTKGSDGRTLPRSSNRPEASAGTVAQLVPHRLAAAMAAVRDRNEWSYAGIPDSTAAARRLLALHLTSADRAHANIVPNEYLEDSRVRAVLTIGAVKGVLTALSAEVHGRRPQGYAAGQFVSLHYTALIDITNGQLAQKRRRVSVLTSRLYAAVLAQQRSRLQTACDRLLDGGDLLTRSRRRLVTQLRQSMRASVLTTQKARLYAYRRHLDRVGLRWWPCAADRVLSDWHDAAPCVCFSPLVFPDDERLVHKWRMPAGEDRRSWYERVVSARRAEKSAISYFRQVSPDVRDVSIHQLNDESRDWRTHDVAVDGRPVDVKNVRRMHGRYVVTDRPKRTMAGDGVAVVGVVSDTNSSQQTVVGEASGLELDRLGHVVGRFARVLELPLVWGGMVGWRRGLGAWLMEYPPTHYKDVRDGLGARRRLFLEAHCRRAAGVVRQAEGLEALLGAVPAWIRGTAAWHHGLLGTQAGIGTVVGHLAEWHRLSTEASIGATSRPALFLFSLLFVLSVVRRGSWERDGTREELVSALFVNDTELGRQHPMGLHDPLKTIYTFIVSLDNLVVRNKDLLAQIDELRLSGVGVLRGRRHGKREFTLLAYCGGCGKNPIWAGDLRELYRSVEAAGRSGTAREARRIGEVEDGCRLCVECFYLICDECGFCKEDCPRCPTQGSHLARSGTDGRRPDGDKLW